MVDPFGLFKEVKILSGSLNASRKVNKNLSRADQKTRIEYGKY